MVVRGKVTVKNPFGDDKGFSTPTARKRPAPGNVTRPRPKVSKPVEFVLLGRDEYGKLMVEASPEMQPFANQIISREVVDKFKEACQRREDGVSADLPLDKFLACDSGSSGSKRASKKRRMPEQETLEICESIPMQSSLSARRKTGPMMSIRVSDTAAIHDYYETCLRAFQQINCRAVCKLWIKLIHPKKQVTNPYNGTIKDKNLDRRASKAKSELPKDPEKTKPAWWAQSIRHKEPDHLKKPERISLMVHLMESCGRDDCEFMEEIEIMQLFEEVAKKKEELSGGTSNDKSGRLMLIHDMCQLRVTQKRWEDGEIDDDTEVQVESHEEHARKAEKEEANREAKYQEALKNKEAKTHSDLQNLELVEEAPMLTPTSSTASSTIYTQSYPTTDVEVHPSNPSQLNTFSPQSMASYQSVPGSSPFHDISISHQALIFGGHHQNPYNTPNIDTQDHMAGLGGPFTPISRSESMAPWAQHNYHPNHVNAFSADPTAGPSHPMHGMPIEDISFTAAPSHHYQHHSQEQAAAAASCFQPVNQVDPRHLGYDSWKFPRLH